MSKILLLGDYSNCHNALATGLKHLGHDVTLVSDGCCYQQSRRDIDLNREPGRIGSIRYLFKALNLFNHDIRGYDVVSIQDPNFLKFKPRILKYFFDRLKRDNGRVFLSAMSTDRPFLDMLEAKDSPLRYSEWFIDGKPSRLYAANTAEWREWHSKELADYQSYVYSRIDGGIAVLYEYWCSLHRILPEKKVFYGGIPVDTDSLRPVDYERKYSAVESGKEKIRIFLGRDRTRLLVKGSDYLEEAAHRIVDRYPDKAELVLVENRSFSEFVQLLRGAHIVLDQIYSYTPATTALMAMAYGLNVVSGAEPDFYDFIGERDNRPIINAPLTVDEIEKSLEMLVLHPEELAERGRKSRLFVEKHNSTEVVARRFEEAFF